VKATTDVATLREVVEWCARTAMTRPTAPILAAVAISATEDALGLAATDLNAWATGEVAASVTEPDRFAVSARLLEQVCKAMPRNGRVDLVAEDGRSLQVSAGALRARLPLLPVEDFPGAPALPSATGTLSAALLHRQLESAAAVGQPFVAESLGKAAVVLQANGDRLVVASTDSRRLLVAELPWISGGPAEPITVPILRDAVKALADACRGAGAEDATLALPTGDLGTATISAGRRSLAVRIGTGVLPYEAILKMAPTEGRTVVADVSDLADLIKRVSVMAEVNEARFRQVTVIIGDGQLCIRASGQAADLADAVAVDHSPEWDSDPWDVAVNPAYLAELLAALPAPRVLITATTARKAMSIGPAGDTEHPVFALVMPIRPPTKDGATP
jgi:DNA polymerase-3 subunit beta